MRRPNEEETPANMGMEIVEHDNNVRTSTGGEDKPKTQHGSNGFLLIC